MSLSQIPLFQEQIQASFPPAARAVAELPAESPVDWGQVVQLRREAAAEISRTLQAYLADSGRPMGDDDRLLMGRSVIRGVVKAHAEQIAARGEALWPPALERQYAEAVEHAVFGYGRLQPLFELPDVENIEINGHENVRVQYADGRRVPQPPVADSDEELVEAIRFLGESATPSRPFDAAHPTMTLALGDRFRLHAIGFGLSHRPSITIRQHILTTVTLRDLVARRMLPEVVARFLHSAVLARKSIVIAGDQGAGKTTFLRALVAAIPRQERFGTIETDYELLTHLQPGRQNVVALQARVGMGEQLNGHWIGEVTVADLIPEALRQNLSRIVVGEVRGVEAGAMFEAMQAGAGSMSTTHAHSAASIMDRLAARVAQGRVVTMPEAYRQIAHNLHLLVHIQLTDDTWRGGLRRREVSEVRQLTGAVENDRPVTHLVYRKTAAGEEFHPDSGFLADLAPYDAAWGL
ncbi:MAG: CpaF/VirB11 family protein [Actinomycetia bacterium]|nr:CpaF/VirB11 family protein [Actinomycetes bacterium]